jgi:protein Tex
MWRASVPNWLATSSRTVIPTAPFKSRDELRKVSGLGPKAYEQSAGFMRIRDGINPLDASAIHPESYPIAEAVLARAGLSPASAIKDRIPALEALTAKTPPEKLAAELGCGLPTLQDILEQLVRPGRDPRADTPAPILRSDVLKMEDLLTGMSLKGTVRNVVDFGAFVDIGVKQDGLLHKSQIPFGTVLKVGRYHRCRNPENRARTRAYRPGMGQSVGIDERNQPLITRISTNL